MPKLLFHKIQKFFYIIEMKKENDDYIVINIFVRNNRQKKEKYFLFFEKDKSHDNKNIFKQFLLKIVIDG